MLTDVAAAPSSPHDIAWAIAVAPDPAERSRLIEKYGVPEEFIEHSLDADERPRMEKSETATLIVLRIPCLEAPDAAVPYTTAPLGLVLTDGAVVAIATRTARVVELLQSAAPTATGWPRHRVVLFVLRMAAETYLRDLKTIDAAVDALEDKLRESLANREVLELLRYQKSLVHFSTALNSMQRLLERLDRDPGFHVPEDDQALLEDVLVEIRQAIEMATISRDLLSEMMDAFASIISNNLNNVMRFLAAFTVILTVPVTVASYWGMNVLLPLQHDGRAFWVLIAASIALAGTLAVVFRRRGWL